MDGKIYRINEEVEEGNKKHWGKIIKIVEEGIKSLRRENNKIVEEGIRKNWGEKYNWKGRGVSKTLSAV